MLTVALAFATVLLAYVVWGKSRRRPVDIIVPPDDGIDQLFRSMAALTWGRVVDGNRVTIVQNHEFFDALLRDIESAQHHVHFEALLWRSHGVASSTAIASRSY